MTPPKEFIRITDLDGSTFWIRRSAILYVYNDPKQKEILTWVVMLNMNPAIGLKLPVEDVLHYLGIEA